jgi:hypothetical protein
MRMSFEGIFVKKDVAKLVQSVEPNLVKALIIDIPFFKEIYLFLVNHTNPGGICELYL